jgi:voltage-gated potassium channel
MSTALKRVIGGITFFLLTCLFGTFAYASAGWSWMDAFYMVVITIFGVGYGEVHPIQTSGLRVVTILLIVLGYSAAAFTVGGFVQMLMEGELNRALNRRRMTKGIGELRDHTILCGFGRAGRILAQELHTGNTQFVVVDIDATKLNDAEAEGFLIVEGNASDDETLEQAGIRRARVLATVLPDDAANVFITLTARGLNPKLEIIARAEYPSSEMKLIRSGATKVVLPAVIGGMKMAQLIMRPSSEQLLKDFNMRAALQEDLIPMGLRLDELTVTAGSSLDGQPLESIQVSGNLGFLIVAVRRTDGTVLVDPPNELRMAAGDALIVLGRGSSFPDLARLSSQKREVSYRGIKLKA